MKPLTPVFSGKRCSQTRMRLSPVAQDSYIFIRGLLAEAQIGVYSWEKEVTQPLRFDIEMAIDTSKAFYSDQLDDTVDYAEVISAINSFLKRNSFDLVEALAEALANHLFEQFHVSGIDLSIAKMAPFPGIDVGVRIQRFR